jgi:hypothetical protein
MLLSEKTKVKSASTYLELQLSPLGHHTPSTDQRTIYVTYSSSPPTTAPHAKAAQGILRPKMMEKST